MASRGLAFLLIVMAVAGCVDPAVREAQVGSIMRPGNTQVPLPPGEWKQVASVDENGGFTVAAGANNLHTARAVYARLEGGRIVQAVFVTTSAGAPADYGYVTGGNCISNAADAYVYFKDVRSATFNSVDCVRVTGNRVFRPPTAQSSAIYRAGYDGAKAYGGLPLRAIWVTFAEAQSGRYLVYDMYFFPERAGQPAATFSASADAIPAASKGYIDGIVAWARQFRPAVRAGTMHLL